MKEFQFSLIITHIKIKNRNENYFQSFVAELNLYEYPCVPKMKLTLPVVQNFIQNWSVS